MFKSSVRTLAMLVAVMIVLSACGSENSQSQASNNGDKKLSGDLTVYTWAGDPFQTAWQDIGNQFTEKTGVKVSFDAVPWENVREKCTLDLASGSGAVDVVYVHPSWFQEYAENGYLKPVDQYASEAEMAEFVPDLLDYYRLNGTVYGLPDFITSQTLAYRKDLFEDKGIEPPKSWDDILAAAELFSDGDNLYGITFPGKRSGALASMFSALLVSNGGWYYDESGKPSVNSNNAIETAEFMQKLAKYAPTGFMNFQWDENSNVASAGKAAMALIMVVNSKWLDDPEKSATAGKWGYVPITSNLGTPGGVVDSYCWSVSTSSKNQEAAAELVKMLAGTEAQAYFTEKSGTCGATKEYYEDQALVAANPVLEALNKTLENTKPYPVWKTWSAQQETLEAELQSVMNGETKPADAMQKLQKQMEQE